MPLMNLRLPYFYIYSIIRVFLKPPPNLPSTTGHLPTDQPTIYHGPTDHWPLRNMRTRNSITNFKWISAKKMRDRVMNKILRIWVIIFRLKPERVIEKIKSLKVKLVNHKHIKQKLHLKRIKTGKNYAETKMVMSKNVRTSSTTKRNMAFFMN